MPFIIYAPTKTCIELVRTINDAKTRQEHDKARWIAQGYRQRCEELGELWPCCSLDDCFEEGDRPMCCGEYLDWVPSGREP